MTSGFNGYLSKPVNSKSLDLELDRMLVIQTRKERHPLNLVKSRSAPKPLQPAKARSHPTNPGRDLALDLLHFRNKLADGRLMFFAYVRKLDALSLLIPPHHRPGRLNRHP